MYLTYCEPERPFGQREVHWYWGAGAYTKSVQSLMGDLHDVYRIKCLKPYNDDDENGCWCTYDRHKTVVFEGVTHQFCSHGTMCRWTDTISSQWLQTQDQESPAFSMSFLLG